MDVAFEVLNGRTITSFRMVIAARRYFDDVVIERTKAVLIMVISDVMDGAFVPHEETLDVRYNPAVAIIGEEEG